VQAGNEEAAMSTFVESFTGLGKTSIKQSDTLLREYYLRERQTETAAPPSVLSGDELRTKAIRFRDRVMYDAEIVRFYESIILELQQEIGRYKKMLGIALEPMPEIVTAYEQEERVPLPVNVAQKMKKPRVGQPEPDNY
jgi:hypothetical protein